MNDLFSSIDNNEPEKKPAEAKPAPAQPTQSAQPAAKPTAARRKSLSSPIR